MVVAVHPKALPLKNGCRAAAPGVTFLQQQQSQHAASPMCIAELPGLTLMLCAAVSLLRYQLCGPARRRWGVQPRRVVQALQGSRREAPT